MADAVRRIMEDMVPELEDLQKRGLASAREKRGGLRERERDVGDARGETETERTGLGVDRRRIARGRVSGGA